MKKIGLVGAALVAWACLPAPTVAQEAAVAPQPPIASAGDQPRTANGIAYVSGGVGLAERAALEKIAKNYNLRLVFATKSGSYLADVRVTVSGPQGKSLFSTTAQGPWLFVKLPAGKYQVSATSGGTPITRTAEVSAKGATTLYFRFPKQ